MASDDAAHEPIRLHTLGSLRLTRGDGTEAHSVLSQPKRCALLIYLVLARPRGLHSRDVLLRLFWPDHDQARARAALSQALYVLRRGLGAHVIVSRGDGEVGIAPGAIEADTILLEEAAAAADWATAAALHAGEFLDGFHVPDSPEFEDWLHNERQRLRRLASQAAACAADAAAAAAPDAALAFARQACRIDRTDEAALRRLLEMLDAHGQRTAAVAEYESYRAWLAADLEIEPSSETRALIEAITARDAAPAERPVRVAPAQPSPPTAIEASAEAAVKAAAEARLAPATRGRSVLRQIRRPRHRLILAAVTVLAVLAGAWRVGAKQTNENVDVAAQTDGVLVLPFEYSGDPRLAYLGDGMVDLLAAKLVDVEGFRIVDPYSTLQRAPAATTDPAIAATHAGDAGATRFIVGRITETGGRLQLTAQLYDRDGRMLGRVGATAAGEAELFGAVDSLSHRLIRETAGPEAARLGLLATRTTASLPALKAYLRGEHAMRRGDYVAALREFERATSADSTFALAHYRRAVAADWTGDAEINMSSRQAARRLADRLPVHMRRFLEAYDAFYEGDFTRAEAVYRELVARHPDQPEIWYQLGETVFHTAPLQGRSFTESRHALERVLELQPGHLDAAVHLVRVAVAAGDRALATRMLAVIEEGPDFAAREAAAVVAFGFRDSAAEAAVLERARRGTAHEAWVMAARVAGFAERLDAAEPLFRPFSGPAGSSEDRSTALAGLAMTYAARGQWQDASRELAQLESFAPAGLYLRAWLALQQHVPVPEAELRRIRDALHGPVPATSGIPEALLPSAELLAELRHYYIGELSLRLGDVAAAERALASLRAGAADHDFAPPTHVLHARILAATGRPEEALEVLEDYRRRQMGRHTFPRWIFFSSAPERVLRAQLLAGVGRETEALAWLGTMNEDLAMVYPFAASHLERARILEAAGQRTAAAGAYRRVLELWSGADAPLNELVGQVRQRLARLD